MSSTKQVHMRVIHVTDHTHARCKELCKRLDISMLDWITSLVDAAYELEEIEPPPLPTPVPRREMQRLIEEIPADRRQLAPWEKPPFWAQPRTTPGT